jgi:exopolyphosphatase/guanosine-5'-triphosphate,3'-diphosphate pyrophosphatase
VEAAAAPHGGGKAGAGAAAAAADAAARTVGSTRAATGESFPVTRAAAVIDVGSNTVRLLVARLDASRPRPTCTRRVRLALGREIETKGRLSRRTVAATAAAVRGLCAHARGRGVEALEVLVTSPGRQAENADELVQAIERAIGMPVQALSAEEEARLAFAGAVASASPPPGLVAVVDLGGASTEVAVGPPDTGPAWFRSVDLGTLRLTTRLLEDQPPGRYEVEAARAAAAEAFAGIAPPLPGVTLVVGGSARALGSVLGPHLGRGELAAATSMLPMCPPEEIRSRFGVGKRRVPLLLAAAIILAEVQRRLAVPLTVCDGGVREGALVLEAARAGDAAAA